LDHPTSNLGDSNWKINTPHVDKFINFSSVPEIIKCIGSADHNDIDKTINIWRTLCMFCHALMQKAGLKETDAIGLTLTCR